MSLPEISYTARVENDGVEVEVLVRLAGDRRYPDMGELGEVTGSAAARLAKQTIDAINREIPF